MKKFISLVTAALFGGFFSVFLFNQFSPKTEQIVVREQGMPISTVDRDGIALPYAPTDFVEASSKSLDAVVHVTTIVEGEDTQMDPWMQFFFGYSYQQRPKRSQMGSGSGVLLSDDGYIVTNNHVIDGANSVEVTLNNKKTFQANVVGRDPATDLAVLKIEGNDLPYLNFGNSDEVKVGEWVLAVGNPFNLNSTVTAGIISAKARDINILRYDRKNGLPPIESFLQTDAAVNPGNSGGALVNTRGELVGINAAIKSNTGSYTGYSFAIPANIARKVVDDLMEFGTVQRAFIGVSIRDIDSELADELGIDDLNGIYVIETSEDGAAAAAGIKKGDVIRKVGGAKVSDVPSLQEKLSAYSPGDKVLIGVERDDAFREYLIQLKNRYGDVQLVKDESVRLRDDLGAVFEVVDKSDLKELGLQNGVRVKNLSDGVLFKSGIREGFIVTKIDNERVYSESDIIEMLEGRKGGILVEGKYPDGTDGYYGFGLR